MKVEVKGDNLIITIPIEKTPQASKSGKTLVVASTRGNYESDVEIQGKKVRIGLNAFINK